MEITTIVASYILASALPRFSTLALGFFFGVGVRVTGVGLSVKVAVGLGHFDTAGP